MRHVLHHISLLLLVVSLLSCDRTPHGVISVDDMADLIVDLNIAQAYMEDNLSDFPNDSTKMVMKQSVFKKHGITIEEYDSSMVWYAHNMEDYIKAHDRALLKLQERYDKLAKSNINEHPERLSPEEFDIPEQAAAAKGGKRPHNIGRLGSIDASATNLWKGRQRFMLTQGARQGFIPFDVVPSSDKQSGDRYQLAYKLTRGGNNFKVSLNADYTDGTTAQISRATNIDGWVTIDLQSDSARQVRRVYGYVSYDMQRGSPAYIDSLMLLRSPFNQNNYGSIHTQRLLDRKK